MYTERDLTGLFTRIGSVFERAHGPECERATRADVERLLAEGYAEAIALELEQARTERRIADLFASGSRRSSPSPAGELRELGARRLSRQNEIERLRAVLLELREFGTSISPADPRPVSPPPR
jgi:hypothetical protein